MAKKSAGKQHIDEIKKARDHDGGSLLENNCSSSENYHLSLMLKWQIVIRQNINEENNHEYYLI